MEKSSVNVGVRLLTTSKDQIAHPKRIMQPAKSQTVLSPNKCYEQREGEREECTIKCSNQKSLRQTRKIRGIG